MMKRLLVTVLTMSAVAMLGLQPAHAQTDSHYCPPYAYYNAAVGQCVLTTRNSQQSNRHR
jgi:hypothetical protein